MDKSANLVLFSIVLTVLLGVAAFDDFLSLHDISRDYVSPSALSGLGITTSKPLPDWTRTPLEWTSVTVSFIFRLLLLGLNLIVLVKLSSRSKTELET